MSKIIIIDGNSLLFRAFYATYLDKDKIMRTKTGQATNAIFAFSNMLAPILTSLKKDDGIFVAFDKGKHTFRHKEYAEYKANRPPCPEDLLTQMPIARELLDKLGIKHYEDDNLEADDICGILAKKAEKLGYEVLIYTSDKDYLQLIDDHITIELIKKGLKDIKEMTPTSFKEEWGFEPIQITDYKGLRGDDSDNLKGIPGVGDKTAKDLITRFHNLENIIANADTKTKVGRNIIEFQDNGRLCKRLSEIAVNEEIPVSIEEVLYKGYDFSEISEFSTHYEFKYLLPKLPKNFRKENTKQKVVTFEEIENADEIEIKDEIALFVDIENVNYHEAEMNGLGFVANDKNYYISLKNLAKSQHFLQILKNPAIKKYTFDYKKVSVVLKNNNIEIDGLYFDLLLATYLIDSSLSNDIESVLAYYKVDISYAYKNQDLLFNNSSKLVSVITAYYSKELYQEVKEKLVSLNQYELLTNIEQPLTIVLSSMESEGFPLSKEKLLEFKTGYQEKVDTLQKEIYSLANEEFNINSPKQVGVILYEKLGLTSNKKGSTSVEYLSQIKYEHPIVSKILEYRKYQKLISTYIDGFIPFIQKDGKVHPTFNQALTSTGRLSCSEPNLQNITTRDEESKKIREAFFYEDPNLNILSLDYSQIELRILASLSNSKSLIDAFNNNLDIHAETAKKVFKLDREPTSNERRQAKAVNFGIVYGISDWGLSEQLDISVAESKKIITNFYEAYPEIRDYLNGLVDFAKDNGYAKTMFERRRYLPEINSSQYQLREFAKRAAMNAPIQGSAADLIKIAMINVYKALKENNYDAKIVSQIHDELIIKVNDDEKDKVKALVQDIMEHSVDLNVSLKVDGGYAKNWFLAK